VYAGATAFSAAFLLIGDGIQHQQCLGNYVIFEVARWTVVPYSIYYYGLLLVAIGYIMRTAPQVNNAAIRRAMVWLAAGYSAFIIPTTAANIIDPSTIHGIPSIMCGFAVILAIILIFAVMPLYRQGISSPLGVVGKIRNMIPDMLRGFFE
jgi:hypothetical protein